MGLGMCQHYRPLGSQPAVQQNVSPAEVGDGGYLTFDSREKLSVFVGEFSTTPIDSIQGTDNIVHSFIIHNAPVDGKRRIVLTETRNGDMISLSRKGVR